MKRWLAGQTILEVGLAIVVAIVLLVATVSTWRYFSKVTVERMAAYKASRHAAIDLMGDFGKQFSFDAPDFDIFDISFGFGTWPDPENVPPYAREACNNTLYEEILNYSSVLMHNSTNLTRNGHNYVRFGFYERWRLSEMRILLYRVGYGWEEQPDGMVAWMSGITDDIPLPSGPEDVPDLDTSLWEGTWQDIENQLVSRSAQTLYDPEFNHILFREYKSTHAHQQITPQNYNLDDMLTNITAPPKLWEEIAERKFALADIARSLSRLARQLTLALSSQCVRAIKLGAADPCVEACDTERDAFAQNIRDGYFTILIEDVPGSEDLLTLAEGNLALYEQCYNTNCGYSPYEDRVPSECDTRCGHLKTAAMEIVAQANRAMLDGDYTLWQELSREANATLMEFEWCYGNCTLETRGS